jgi:hypothetical protein
MSGEGPHEPDPGHAPDTQRQVSRMVDTTGLRRRIAATWSAGGSSTRTAILLGGTITAALAGAFLFGAWHVLFGYFVVGNPRAGLFGLVLATVSGILLAAALAIARRRIPPA